MLRIGLTGGIGSGKTAVSNLFTGLGITVIDTDQIAHELTATGEPAVTAIAKLFGNEVLHSDGSLKRQLLREIIFSDSQKREQLEQLLHPLIQDRAVKLMQQINDPYCILVVPLLLEKGWQSLVDRVLVVDTSPELQLSRAIARDHRSESEIRAILDAQITRQQRLAMADDVINNEAGLAELAPQADVLHQKYLQLASMAQLPDPTTS